MNRILRQFSAYDFFGHITVGIYFFAILFLFSLLLGKSIDVLKNFNAQSSILLIFISYITSQVIQGATKCCLEYFSFEKNMKEQNKEKWSHVFKKAEDFFNLKENSEHLFDYPYLYVLQYDNSGSVVRFNALYGLSRGLFGVSVLSSFVSLGLLICSFFTDFFISKWWWLALTVSFLIFSIVFFYRSKKFYKLLGEKTMMLFDIFYEKGVK